jgi:hypothetical protein
VQAYSTSACVCWTTRFIRGFVSCWHLAGPRCQPPTVACSVPLLHAYCDWCSCAYSWLSAIGGFQLMEGESRTCAQHLCLLDNLLHERLGLVLSFGRALYHEPPTVTIHVAHLVLFCVCGLCLTTGLV